MRMPGNVPFPLEPFNSSVRDDTVGLKVQEIPEEIQPESDYFSRYDG